MIWSLKFKIIHNWFMLFKVSHFNPELKCLKKREKVIDKKVRRDKVFS